MTEQNLVGQRQRAVLDGTDGVQVLRQPFVDRRHNILSWFDLNQSKALLRLFILRFLRALPGGAVGAMLSKLATFVVEAGLSRLNRQVKLPSSRGAE